MQLVSDAQFVHQTQDVGVTAKEMVVKVLDASPKQGERSSLAAPRPILFQHSDGVTLLLQFVSSR
jgi:hypothetical protein